MGRPVVAIDGLSSLLRSPSTALRPGFSSVRADVPGGEAATVAESGAGILFLTRRAALCSLERGSRVRH